MSCTVTRFAGETLLADAIHMTAKWGLVRPNDNVVVIQMLHDSLTIKIVSVDEYGRGIASIQPQSLKDMIEVRLQLPKDVWLWHCADSVLGLPISLRAQQGPIPV